MLATALSLVMYCSASRRRRRADQHELSAQCHVHNTQSITGHFHLIFGGAIVIMYFAMAYDLWPHLRTR